MNSSMFRLSRILLFTAAGCLLASCYAEPTGRSKTDPFFKEIYTILNEEQSHAQQYINPRNLNIAIPIQVRTVKQGGFIVADGKTNQIKLLDNNGYTLSQAGAKGRGPGEFGTINHIQVDDRGRMYVVDIKLKRISVFSIARQQVLYEQSFPLSYESEGYLKALHVGPQGRYGVYSSKVLFKQDRNRHTLYRLNKRFEPVENVLEMPGNRRIANELGIMIKHPLGPRTFWDFRDSLFYYGTSYDFKIHTLNLSTGDTATIAPIDLPPRRKTPMNTEYLFERLAPIFEVDPVFEDAIDQSDYLPLMDEIVAGRERILLNTYYAGGSDGVIFSIDTRQDRIRYIRIPPNYVVHDLHGNTLYGIDYSDPGNARIMLMELNDN